MKSAMVNGKRESITFRTNSEMYTRMSHGGLKTAQYGADIYNVDNNKNYIVIVATSHNGSTLSRTVKAITAESYEKILDLYDAYNALDYHQALMSELGFK